MGTLYLVATPIGNLEDLSPRGVRILHQVCLIAAEDTRVTRKLLAYFDLHTPMTSYFEHNKLTKLETILAALGEGDVALVSDAGTPTINDPGYELVKAAIARGYNVCPIPGPSAPIAALTASGLPTDSFLYLGYLPRKIQERRELLERIRDIPYTLIFLESPRRLLTALKDLLSLLGDRQISVAREVTKLHEQFWRGKIGSALEYFNQNEPRGEFTLVIAGKPRDKRKKWEEEKVIIAIKLGIRLGEPASTMAKRLADESGWDRRVLYQLATKYQKDE